MKKLMIVAAIAMAAFASDAAQYVWKNKTAGKIYDGNATSTYTGTAYIYGNKGATTQEKIFALLAGTAEGDWKALSLDNNSVSSGSISSKDPTTDYFTYDGDISAFIVIDDGDKFYIGPTQGATDPGLGTGTINFEVGKTESQKIIGAASDGWKGAGWYTAVPEPTSGLLLLLGVAGLALRRRRA